MLRGCGGAIARDPNRSGRFRLPRPARTRPAMAPRPSRDLAPYPRGVRQDRRVPLRAVRAAALPTASPRSTSARSSGRRHVIRGASTTAAAPPPGTKPSAGAFTRNKDALCGTVCGVKKWRIARQATYLRQTRGIPPDGHLPLQMKTFLSPPATQVEV